MEQQLTIEERQRFWTALDKMEQSARKVDKLYVAIVGDKELQQEGIIERLEKVESQVDKMELMLQRAKGWLAGAVFVGGVGGYVLNSLIKVLVK